MKWLLSVGAMTLTLMFSAYAEPPSQLILPPGFFKCFDLLRLERLQFDPKDGSVRIDVNGNNQMELLHEYFRVRGWLRGYFPAMNMIRSLNCLTPDVTNSTEQKEWMPWIYSYCRAHPTENIEDVALALAKAFSGSSNKDTK